MRSFPVASLDHEFISYGLSFFQHDIYIVKIPLLQKKHLLISPITIVKPHPAVVIHPPAGKRTHNIKIPAGHFCRKRKEKVDPGIISFNGTISASTSFLIKKRPLISLS